jgi:hypothetical protein
LGPKGVSIRRSDGRSIHPTFDPATVYLAGLADLLVRSGKSVAVGIPPDARHLPLIIAAVMVVAETLDRDDLGGRRGVLLVSSDLDLRSRYSMLAVDKVALDTAHTGSRLRPDGSLVRLSDNGRPARGGGVCFFLPRSPLPNRISFQPNLIVLDLRYGRLARRAKDLADWARSISKGCGILSFFTVGDVDTETALGSAGYARFVLDHRAIAACDRDTTFTADSPREQVDWDLKEAPSFLRRAHSISEIPLPAELHDRYQSLKSLIDEHSRIDTPDLRRARWLLATLRQLPVPMSWYEQAARDQGRSTIRRMINHLGARSSRGSERIGPVIQSMQMQLDELYTHLEIENPRSLALARNLHRRSRATPDTNQVLLLRDSVMHHAFQQWIAIEPPTGMSLPANAVITDCATAEDLVSLKPSTVLINGPLAPRYRWLLGALLAPEVIFVCYRDEVPAIEGQLKKFYDTTSPSEACIGRNRFIASLSGSPPPTSGPVEPALPGLELRLPAPAAAATGSDKPRMKTVPGGFSGLRDFLDRLKEEESRPAQQTQSPWDDDTHDDDIALDELDNTQPTTLAGDVQCLPLNVNTRWLGTCRLFLPLNAPIEFIRPPDSNVVRMPPEDVHVGDVLLRIEDGGRQGLFDRVVELAERQPEYSHLASFRRHWKIACQRLANKYSDGQGPDYAALLADLQLNGAPIKSELAVRWWVKELAIGPEKLASIAAVGKILSDRALIDEARAFDRAFRQIRGLHQGLGRRLSGAILRSFRHLQFTGDAEPSDMLGDQLGLPVDELVESIELAEVLEVGKSALVPANTIDRLLRRN